MKLDEVSKDGMPKDSMGIYWLASDSLRLIENVKSFKLSEEGDWLAFLSTEDLRPDCPTSKKKKKKKKKPDCEKSKTSGKTLTVYNPVTGVEKVIDQVVDYEFNRQGSLMVFSTSLKGDKDTLRGGLAVWPLALGALAWRRCRPLQHRRGRQRQR